MLDKLQELQELINHIFAMQFVNRMLIYMYKCEAGPNSSITNRNFPREMTKM